MELDRMLKALGEPTRLKIYCALLERKHCVRSLSKKLGISESAVSHKLCFRHSAGAEFGGKPAVDADVGDTAEAENESNDHVSVISAADGTDGFHSDTGRPRQRGPAGTAVCGNQL